MAKGIFLRLKEDAVQNPISLIKQFGVTLAISRQLSTRVYDSPNVSPLLAYVHRALRFDPLPTRDRQVSKAGQPAHIRRILEHGGYSAATVLGGNNAKKGKGGTSAVAVTPPAFSLWQRWLASLRFSLLVRPTSDRSGADRSRHRRARECAVHLAPAACADMDRLAC